MQHITPLRQSIIELIKTYHLMSVKEIVVALEKSENFVNKSTVYRALEYLLAEGILLKLQFLDKDAQYEVVDEPHDHMVCTSCGLVEKTRPASEELKHIGSFQVQHRHVTYYGLCKKCSKNTGKRGITSLIGL